MTPTTKRSRLAPAHPAAAISQERSEGGRKFRTPTSPRDRDEGRVRRAHRRRLTRGVSCALVVFTAALTFGTGSAISNTKGEHCIHPNGLDLNQFYGVSETIVAPYCAQLRAGEHWTVVAGWIMQTTFATVPSGFVPAAGATTPLDDFRAKFVSARVVVDPGTRQERTYVFPNSDQLWTGLFQGSLPFVNTITLGRFHPVSEGRHVLDLYWRFSAMHCDGFGEVVSSDISITNCLLPGETQYWHGLTFDVAPAAS